MSHRLAIALLVSTVALSHSTDVKSTPVEKVITLLNKLSAKIQDEGASEAKSYDKFSCFCKDQANEKVLALEREDARIAKLAAQIAEERAKADQYDQEGQVLRSYITTEETEKDRAQRLRANQTNTYEINKHNLEVAIKAIRAAIAAMDTAVANVKAQTLIQSAEEAIRKVKPSFVSLDQQPSTKLTGSGEEAQKGPVYEVKSHDMMGVMRDLEREFTQEMARLEIEEGNLASEYIQVEGARAYKLTAYHRDRDQKDKLYAEFVEYWSRDRGFHDEEWAARLADQAFLDELTRQCEIKAQEWDQRSQFRQSELTAIAQAIEVLKSMGGGAAPAFLQLQSAEVAPHKQFQPLITFLSQKAKVLKSQVLTSVAAKVGSGGDNFEKVRSLLNDLIEKLEADAADEEAQKSYCDTEISKEVQSRDQKHEEIESALASIDSSNTEIVRIKKEMASYQSAVAELEQARNEMTLLRGSEKAQNAKNIAEATESDRAVKQAIGIIADFYGMSLAQKAVHKKQDPAAEPIVDRHGNSLADYAPDTFSGTYHGKQTESAGIKGLLEIISSDFERAISTTQQQETEAQSAYEEELKRTQAEIDSKHLLLEQRDAEFASQESALSGFKEAKADAEQLHGEVLATLETLKKACMENMDSAEQRQKSRDDEIAALQQAVQLLENWKNA